MDEVARAAHISRPGLSFLFSSEVALFRAAVTQALERDLATVATVLADPGQALADRLLEAFDTWQHVARGQAPGRVLRRLPRPDVALDLLLR